MAIDASALLEKVIGLIEKDVDRIAKLAEKGKLEHSVASDLTKYSGALLALTDTVESKEKAEKNKLAKMSTEELIEMAKNVIKTK